MKSVLVIFNIKLEVQLNIKNYSSFNRTHDMLTYKLVLFNIIDAK